MAFGQVKPGYIGLVKSLGDVENIRCTSFSVGPKQSMLFYNHVIGLRDDNYIGNETKGPMPEEGTSTPNVQRKICRPSTFIASGGINLPLTEDNFQGIYDYARSAAAFDMDFVYYCGGGRSFKECRINSFDFNATAGEIVTIGLDIMSKSVEDQSTSVSYEEAKKLVTWDMVSVSVTIGSSLFTIDPTMINALSFKINNNVNPIYVTGGNSYYPLGPVDLRVGMQEVSGVISVYLSEGQNLIPIDETAGSLEVDMGAIGSFSSPIAFEACNPEGSIGPVVISLPFVGVDSLS